MWLFFKEMMIQGISKFVPLIRPFHSGRKQWKRSLDKETRDMIRNKHSLWRGYIRTRDEDILKQFKILRNRVKSRVRERDREEQLNIARNSKNNPQRILEIRK